MIASLLLGLLSVQSTFLLPNDFGVNRVVYPAAEPKPALRYSLLPTLETLRPGNAALLYFRLFQRLPEVHGFGKATLVAEWNNQPIDTLPISDVELMLKQTRSLLDYLDQAAQLDTCDWNGVDLFHGTLSPPPIDELTPARTVALLHQLRVRLAIRQRRFDDAVQQLRVGLQFARHVGSGPTMIHFLVGTSIAKLYLDTIEELMGATRFTEPLLGIVATAEAVDRSRYGLCVGSGLFCERLAARLPP